MAGVLTVSVDRCHELAAFRDARLAPELAAASEAMALRLDGVLTAPGVSPELAGSFQAAGPFGQGNSEPRFAMPHVRVVYAARVGGAPVRFRLAASSGERIGGIAFRAGDSPLGDALLSGDRPVWHAVGRLKLDEWRGRRRVDFHLEDLAAAN